MNPFYLTFSHPPTLGVTSALSLQGPTRIVRVIIYWILEFYLFISSFFLKDLDLTEKLVGCMKEHNMFDTEEGQSHRLLILGKLNELMKKWIIQVSLEKVSAYTVQYCTRSIYMMSMYNHRVSLKRKQKKWEGKSSLLDRTV